MSEPVKQWIQRSQPIEYCVKPIFRHRHGQYICENCGATIANHYFAPSVCYRIPLDEPEKTIEAAPTPGKTLGRDILIGIAITVLAVGGWLLLAYFQHGGSIIGK